MVTRGKWFCMIFGHRWTMLCDGGAAGLSRRWCPVCGAQQRREAFGRWTEEKRQLTK